MTLPSTVGKLVALWKTKLTELTYDNNEQIAYDIVSSLAGNDLLWAEWYESGKEKNIQKVFDNAADLELPNGISIKDASEREKRWQIVRACVKELDTVYLKSKNSKRKG